ncbi:Sulfur carrier protein adenylyltransferase ThiF [Candidatus Rhodobacter oscarellae]|uniref:Sulfur carrier protein adenylyltransferase ThiF n=1 Tax=Candidatus Rhodobacter oscarellae TaxID=1675527 RepID=A0A0J9E9Z6_9RHOB|nr:ThiF family adenylyltransferase [Candidatus Rhodobacter lobularis]KMW59466.1 Sulfur carrier protein adenylyltransferase ThiF [Candidatus Rhodobacter lobularis]
MSRYARQEILPEVGAAGQSRLAAARILVVGAGGLAAPALPLLAGAGVGQITIVDPDVVSLTNLHRQTLFSEQDVGLLKAEIACRRCQALNSEIAVLAVPEALTPANAGALVGAADLVLDCADSYAASYILSDSCLAAGKPLISASALGLSGYVGGFCGGAPSLRAVFPDAPESGASCATAGVLGPVVGMLGAMQAQMALGLLIAPCGHSSPLGQVVNLDAMSLRTSIFRFDDAPEPELRFSFAARADLNDGDTIVDLRGHQEAPEPIHPAARRVAPQDISRIAPRQGRLALACATGLRAWRAAETLHPDWPGEIVLVAASAS